MKTTASYRITATLAGAMISAGILASGLPFQPVEPHTSYLADYGSAISADDSEARSQAGGVRHMGDHRSSPGYFERMNGVGE